MNDVLALEETWWLVSPGNPLKAGASDMAPLALRLASARKMGRRAAIVPTAIEARLETRYTADTIARLVRLYPKRQFIWIMGADNLAEFHRWRGWRDLARKVPIAVIARPGYDRHARAAPAMGWLRRNVRPANQRLKWTKWRPPAIVLLRFRLDPTSATLLRQSDPDWPTQFASLSGPAHADRLTHHPFP